MLKRLLSPKTCAKCCNCCIFEPQSAWELPTFSANAVACLPQTNPALTVTPTEDGKRYRIALPYDQNGKAQPCPFLNAASGCTLSAEEKPFACSLWPIRVMKKDDRLGLALYQGCEGLPTEKLEEIRLLLDDGLRTRIMQEVQLDPTLVLPYHPNYIWIE